MKKNLCVFLAAVLLLGCLPVTALAEQNFPVYRLFNPYSGEHLLSTNQTEIDNLTSHGWSMDGAAWYSVPRGDTVYRLYNPYDGSHLYTRNQPEIEKCLSLGWLMDGPVSYSETKENGLPIYRLFNPYADAHYHLYTVNQEEIDTLTSLGWIQEGVAWYAAGTHVHDFSQNVKITAPTCTEEGYSLGTCSCGETKEFDATPALGHSWGEWKVTKPATDQAEGTETRICSRCQKEETRAIDKGHTHSFGTEWESNETHHWHACACGEKSGYGEHTWGEWDILSEPEKDENGWEERVCSTCKKVEGREIPALEHQHNWSEFVKGNLVESHNYFNTYEWVATCSECGETRSKHLDEATSYGDNVASEMISCVNAERTSHGLKPLWTDGNWNSWAMSRAKRLHIDMSHTGAEHVIGNQKVCAENITADNAKDYADRGDSLDGAELYRRFFTSPAHKANMLMENAHGIAVGVDYDPNTGHLTCAMVLVMDEDQYIEDQNQVDPQTCQHVWEEESREITSDTGIRVEFIQHLICRKCNSKDVQSGFEIHEEKLAAFPEQTIAAVNAERTALGRPVLKVVGGAAAAYTQRRADELVNNFSHSGSGGNYDGYVMLAENIAKTSASVANGEEFYYMFRDSQQGHHEAMIDPAVTYISVAFAHDPDGNFVVCAMELFYSLLE